MFGSQFPYRFFYLLFTCGLAFGLSTGEIIMSISSIALAVTWVVEMKFRSKWKRIRSLSFSPLIVLLLYLVHVIWMLSTTNLDRGANDLVLKLPLVCFPIVFGSITSFTKKEWILIIASFIGGLLINSFVGYSIYFRALVDQVEINPRSLSIFISHIRLSLLLGLAIFLLCLGAYKSTTWLRYIYIAFIGWFSYFIRVLESGTGYISLLFALGFFVFLLWRTAQHKKIKWFISLGSFIAVGAGILYVFFVYKNLTEIRDKNDLSQLDEYSPSGEFYIHDCDSKWLENGNYVWLYIAPQEATKAWGERSSIPLDSLDKKGQPMFGTLYRYLTSKGLRKDRNGIFSLSLIEIADIENGRSSYLEPKSGLTARIETILYELINFSLDHNPNGHSVVQRIHYFDAGLSIFRNNLWFGTGTGDLQNAFNEEYEKKNSPLLPEHRLRAHNQFLTLLIAFGIVGSVFCLLSLSLPIFLIKNPGPIFWFFMLLAIVGFLVDDLLETQAGVSFFAFFYCLFLFQKNELLSFGKFLSNNKPSVEK